MGGVVRATGGAAVATAAVVVAVKRAGVFLHFVAPHLPEMNHMRQRESVLRVNVFGCFRSSSPWAK